MSAMLPDAAERSEPDASDALAELGAFLRARRERLAPTDRTARSRTPGRTRDEVAHDAEIGVDWYARIEQGRAKGLSEPTLCSIVHALTLDECAMRYVLALLSASRTDSDGEATPPASISTARLVGTMDTTPAYVLDEDWTISGYNRAALVLYEGLERAEGVRNNCLWQHFMNERFVSALHDAEHVFAYLAALFRYSTARRAGTAVRSQLIAELLAASPAFARHWRASEVADWGEAVKAFTFPTLGHLRFTNVSHRIESMGGPSCRLVTYVPLEGTQTAEVIARAVGNS